MTSFARIAQIVLLAAISSAACSSGDGRDDSTPPAIAQAADRTLDAGSARVIAHVESSNQAVAIEMDGVYDFDRQRGDFAFDIDSAGISGATNGVADGGTLYLDIGEDLVPGKRWVRIDAGSAPGEGVGTVGSPTLQASPTTSLRYLDGAESVEKVGTEIVRQIRTTRYKMRIDVERAARAQEDDVGDALERIGKLELGAEAWIDDQGRLRRFEFTIPLSELPNAPNNASGRLTVSMDLFEFGADVDVETPPADQIAEISELPKTGG